ncbi:MAG: hypothetical protein IT535_12670 [Bauldia sp.]|nr:hypothetical protein [Bauldia sp.]
MLRFGIVTREGLLEAAAAAPAKIAPAVAFPLVETFTGTLSESEEEALAFLYGGIPAGPSIKLTWRERLRAIDDIILPEIERRFARERTIRVHDMAASNAISSVDFFEQLAATGRALSYLASDFYDALLVVSLPGGRWRVVFNAEGEPLQIVGRRMVLASAGERKRFPVNRLVHRWAEGRLVPKARALLAAGKAERIALFHPEALALAARDERFRLGRENVFEPPRGPFEVVKIVSFLSPHRFDRDTVRRALMAITPTIAEGGLLAVGRTQGTGDRLDASLFAREGGRLVWVADVRDGYAYKDVVTGLG